MIVVTAVQKHPMSAKAITTQDAPAPVGPYNQAVLAGEWLYCSGQTHYKQMLFFLYVKVLKIHRNFQHHEEWKHLGYVL